MIQQKLHPFDIEEMIAREDDPKARAYLIILSSLHNAQVANTSATLEIKRSLDEHLNNFEKQTEEHRLLMKVLPPWAALLSIKVAFVLIVAASLDVVADSLPWLTAVFAGICAWNAVQIMRLRKTTPG